MRVGATIRKWLHREDELSDIERAKRWAAAREPYALTDAEFDEMVKRDTADPAFQKALKEADEMRQQSR